jgi:hypothetical protein
MLEIRVPWIHLLPYHPTTAKDSKRIPAEEFLFCFSLLLPAALAPTSPPEEEEEEEEEEEASALWSLPLVIRPKQQQQHCDSRASPWRTAIANKNRRKIPN